MIDSDALEAVIKPTISLIMSTRNRGHRLQPCLRAIERLKCKRPWELILIDNGSTDETRTILDDYGQLHLDAEITIATEPRAGLSRALNKCLELAKGEIIAFMDDDCYPNSDLLDRIIEAMERRRLDYLGGRVELFDRNDAHITIKTDSQPSDIPAHSYVRPGLLHGCNMAIRRRVFDRVGSFDSAFGVGGFFRSSGDVEFLQRASLAGFIGGYEPSVITSHHHRRQGPAVARLRRSYAVGRGAFYAKLTLFNPSFMGKLLAERRNAAGSTFALLKIFYWTIRRNMGIAGYVSFGFFLYFAACPFVALLRRLRS